MSIILILSIITPFIFVFICGKYFGCNFSPSYNERIDMFLKQEEWQKRFTYLEERRK